MEDEIRDQGRPDTGNTRIVCRTGSPIDLDDLEIVNPQGRARSSSWRRETTTPTRT